MPASSSAGITISPPPPAMASTAPAKNATPNKASSSQGSGLSNVLGAAFRGQFDLFLALAEAGFAVFVGGIDAAVAGHALFVFRAVEVLWRQGHPAGVAQFVIAFLQAVTNRNTAVEDETFAVPLAVFGGHFFEVFQDAALEVIDLVDALAQQVVRGFLATDAAGAEHRDALVVEPLLVFSPPVGKLTEGFRFRIDRALEGADLDLVVVAG